MKAKELAALLMEHPDFEVVALCTDKSMSRKDNGYIGYERFTFSGIADIGADDKELIVKIAIDRTEMRCTKS